MGADRRWRVVAGVGLVVAAVGWLAAELGHWVLGAGLIAAGAALAGVTAYRRVRPSARSKALIGRGTVRPAAITAPPRASTS
jgi:hypothetical protein